MFLISLTKRKDDHLLTKHESAEAPTCSSHVPVSTGESELAVAGAASLSGTAKASPGSARALAGGGARQAGRDAAPRMPLPF